IQERRRQARDECTAVDQSTPTITSLALITATAALPLASLSSSTASLVIEAGTMTPPPISIRIWDVAAPFATSTMVPLSCLRALIFIWNPFYGDKPGAE